MFHFFLLLKSAPETKVYEAKVAWNCRFTRKILSRKQFVEIRSCEFLRRKKNGKFHFLNKILFFRFSVMLLLLLCNHTNLDTVSYAKSFESVLAHCAYFKFWVFFIFYLNHLDKVVLNCCLTIIHTYCIFLSILFYSNLRIFSAQHLHCNTVTYYETGCISESWQYMFFMH